MTVTLCGPDELGRWVLHSPSGLAYSLIERHEDHIAAAELFGWSPPEGVSEQEELISVALDWLMNCIGSDIEAPVEIAAYFREREDEEDAQERNQS